MAKRGRPRKDQRWRKCERVDLRVDAAEKEAFQLAADRANQELSVWIRMQLHRAAESELSSASPIKAVGEQTPVARDRVENVGNDDQA